MLEKNDSLAHQCLVSPVLLAQLRASMAVEPQERGVLLRRFINLGDGLKELLAQPDVVAVDLPGGSFVALLDGQSLGRVAFFDVGGEGISRPIGGILSLRRDLYHVSMEGAARPLLSDLPPEVHYAAAGYSGFMGGGSPCVKGLLPGLLARSRDAQGGLVFGAAEAGRVDEDAVAEVSLAGRARWYVVAANSIHERPLEHQQVALMHPVGGTHQKFCCRLRSIGSVVVKFARAGTPQAEALVANAIALRVLGGAGFDVATTGIVTQDGLVFHESLRLDRISQGGRRVLTSATHVDEVLLNSGGGWLGFAATAREEGLLSEEDAARLKILALFSSMVRGDDWRLSGDLDDLLLTPRVLLSPMDGYALAATHSLGLGRAEKSPWRASDIEGLRIAPADCPARIAPLWDSAFALAGRYFEMVSAGVQIQPLGVT